MVDQRREPRTSLAILEMPNHGISECAEIGVESNLDTIQFLLSVEHAEV